MVGSYVGRFAPSPTGPLHAGSLVAALASWLDARAHAGQWLVRIEDVDTGRSLAGMDRIILGQLAQCGLKSDLPPIYQSRQTARYQQAIDALIGSGFAYPCGCSRKNIEETLLRSGLAKSRNSELVYPGTCRTGLAGKSARVYRFSTQLFSLYLTRMHTEKALDALHSGATFSPQCQLGPPMSATTPSLLTVPDTKLHWQDRRLGKQSQDVSAEVGDFVLKRADGCFAYQLAVVVDDAAQGVTDVVRGVDLADNAARQILLQCALGIPTPHYLHTPLVLGKNGEKLSKQNGAQALDLSRPLDALNSAAAALGLSAQPDPTEALTQWVTQWSTRVLGASKSIASNT